MQIESSQGGFGWMARIEITKPTHTTRGSTLTPSSCGFHYPPVQRQNGEANSPSSPDRLLEAVFLASHPKSAVIVAERNRLRSAETSSDHGRILQDLTQTVVDRWTADFLRTKTSTSLGNDKKSRNSSPAAPTTRSDADGVDARMRQAFAEVN